VSPQPVAWPPRQATLARLARFGVTPRRSLGQNFLVDDNILRLILDRVQAQPSDVILEVGTGLGVLTEALLAEAGYVHSFEVDRSLRESLLRVFADQGERLGLHFQDVLSAELERLQPAPTLCASNLPYSIAAPFLAEAVARLPQVRRYVVMVQREVAERLAAAPGSKIYGGISVWVQLFASVKEMRPLSRRIFYPVPRVDSILLTLERRKVRGLPAGDPVLVRWVIDSAFASRRKMIVNSLSAATGLAKAEAEAVLRDADLAPTLRAEQVSPAGYLALAEAFCSRSLRPPATPPGMVGRIATPRGEQQ